MSVKRHQESDFEKLCALVKSLEDKNEDVFLLFMASKGENGVRWCPDCVKAEPEVDGFLAKLKLKSDVHLVVVDLEKAYLRDPTNPYYTSEKFQLRKVPTLMKSNQKRTLVEEDCWNDDLLTDLFACVCRAVNCISEIEKVMETRNMGYREILMYSCHHHHLQVDELLIQPENNFAEQSPSYRQM